MAMRRLSGKEFLLLFEAWVLLAAARLILIFAPFKKIAPLLGHLNKDEPSLSTTENKFTLTHLSLAIARACRYSFWRTQCFEQALAAKIMLRRRGIHSTIYFGVKHVDNGNKTIAAHAWIESEGITLTGAMGKDSFSIISSYNS